MSRRITVTLTVSQLDAVLAACDDHGQGLRDNTEIKGTAAQLRVLDNAVEALTAARYRHTTTEDAR